MKFSKTILTVAFVQILVLSAYTQNLKEDTVSAKNYFEKAEDFLYNNSLDTAIIYFEKSAYLYEKHKLWRKYLLNVIKIGECNQYLWKLDQAITSVKPAIVKVKPYLNKNDTILAEVYQLLGFQYYFKTYLDSTITYWEEALRIRKKAYGLNHAKTAFLLNALGIAYNDKNEYDESLQYYFDALDIYKKIYGTNHSRVAKCYNNIGVVHFWRSEFDLALDYYFKALEVRREIYGVKHEEVASSYNNIAIIYDEKKEDNLALEYHFKSLQIRKEILGEKHFDVADSYNGIGLVYLNLKNYDNAREYLLKSIDIKKELFGDVHSYVAIGYTNMGIYFNRTDQNDLALQNHIKALSIYKDLFGENHIDVAFCYDNIGSIHTKSKKYDLALQFHYKALNIFMNILGGKHQEVALSYYSIGRILAAKNNFNQSIQYFQKSVASNIRSFQDTLNVHSLPVINNYLSWEELFSALYAKTELYQNHYLKLEGMSKESALETALLHFHACDTLILNERKNMRTKSDKISLGNYADKVYKGAVNVCNKLSLLSNDKILAQYYKELAFYFSERNKSSVLLEALAGSEAQKFAGIPENLLKLEHKLNTDMALFKKILAEDQDSIVITRFRDKLFEANRKYDSLIYIFEKSYPNYFELKYSQHPVKIEDIQTLTDKNTAILSYFVGDDMITIFVVTQKKFDVFQVNKPKNLNTLISEIRENISNTSLISADYDNNTNFSVEYFRTKSPEIYTLLFPARLKKFLGKKIKSLVIIPDGYLSVLPFETLLTSEYNEHWEGWSNYDFFSDMPFLIKDYNISYSYSANLFHKTNPKTKDKPEFKYISDWLALAPVFDNDSISGTNLRTRNLIENNSLDEKGNINTRVWLRDGSYITPLPGSEEETKSIFSIFQDNNKKAVLKTHKYANEEYIKSGILKDFRFLHIATHGMVNEEKPELSCILLAQDTTSYEDNILFSGEIYNLELNADLTVLSACETGLGKIEEGEGVIGLTRALLYAGSKNIIVSLWQVSDESTNQLMVDFYKNIFENEDKDFSEHLSKSKLKLIEEGKYAHPFFWSPFVLIGK